MLRLAAVVLSVALGTGNAASGSNRARGLEAPTAGKPHRKKSSVHLEFYYETLCPYCHELFDGSFRQIWGDEDFRERITVELIPFGNARVVQEDKISQGYHFFHPDAKYPVIICQHQEGECLGNEIHTCVTHMHDVNKTVDLALCMVGKAQQGQGIEKASYDCLMKLEIDPQKVKDCVGSDENVKRMILHGFRSMRKELNRSYVPWVMAESAHVEVGDDHDLITPVCGMLTPPLPALCSQRLQSKGSDPAALASTRHSFLVQDSELAAEMLLSPLQDAKTPVRRSLAEDMPSWM